MRSIVLFCLLTAALWPRLVAQDLEQLNREAIDLIGKGEYERSLRIGQALYDLQPYSPEAYNIIGFNQMILGHTDNAGLYLNVALQIEPTEFASYVNSAYYFVLKGDMQRAKGQVVESIRLYPTDFDLTLLLDEMKLVGTKTNHGTAFAELSEFYKQTFNSSKERIPRLADFINDIRGIAATDPGRVKQLSHSYAAKFNALGWNDVAIEVYGYSSLWLRDARNLSDAVEMAQGGYQLLLGKNYRNNTFVASFLLHQLILAYSALGNNERVVQYLDEMKALSDKLTVHYFDTWSYIEAANAFYRLGKEDDNLNWAVAAYNLAKKAGFSAGRAMAAMALSNAYGLRRLEGGGPKALQYAEEGLQIANENKLTSYLNGIVGALALRYMSVPTRESQEKAIYSLGSLAALQERDKLYADAATTLNNIGAIYYARGAFEDAASYFERSAHFSQSEIDRLKMSDHDKLTFYESQISAYDFLTACYARLNNPEGAFYSMERSRSRVLGERMAKGANVPVSSLSELQEMLADDEACVLYDLFSGHEVSILVVTKKNAQVLFQRDDSFIGDIKDKYLDRMNTEHRERGGLENSKPVDREMRVSSADFQKVTQLTRKFFEHPGAADEILTEYLRGYYRFLILPVANRLTAVKKLIVSPDDVLNFIPFEALQQYDGKYLVERYEIKYMHSTSVMKQIRNREYAASRKPLLAMGGARFEQIKVTAPSVRTQEDMNALQLEVEENVRLGRSQRRAYAALFGTQPLNALPGTIDEIKSIQKTIPSADVFFGMDMSENRIKEMDQNGQLGQYKVLHLATHGFVVNEIPELSGVAMSIVEPEHGGEDGFLNVNEISSLHLKSDLTVLSACQTALGKIYSGEGVTGLTQSLLIAGSNSALVSLWPVNDTSTMVFMSELYKEALKGTPYAQVVSDLKRKFIKGQFGKQFRHPNYWAPFVYVGK